jgi:dephospho-CoA kinase
MEKAEELSARRFGSRTQYKTNIIELDRLKEEMFKYGDQIAEANEALEKISKEAQESKANLDWLK